MRLSLLSAKTDGRHGNMQSDTRIFDRFSDQLSRDAHLQPNA
jgi:hypothetical protein